MVTRGRHGCYAVPENGSIAQSGAADAHRCIMVQARPRPAEYKCVGPQAQGRAPLGRPIGSSSSIAAGNKPTVRGLTTIAPYKPAPAKAGVSVATSATKPRDGQFM